MIIQEVKDIRFWMDARGRDITGEKDIPGDIMVFGVSWHNGGGIAIIPSAEARPEFAPRTWLFSFCGKKAGNWYVKRWAVEGGNKGQALKALAGRAKGFGFEAVMIFQVDRPMTKEERELRDELRVYKRPVAI